jgi:excinuclease UvrABC ATPase subunit
MLASLPVLLRGATDMGLVLIIGGAFAVWLLRAYFAPFAACRRCKGAKSNSFTRAFGLRTRYGACRKCKGTGSRQVLGSRRVHRMVRSARSSWGSGRD